MTQRPRHASPGSADAAHPRVPGDGPPGIWRDHLGTRAHGPQTQLTRGFQGVAPVGYDATTSAREPTVRRCSSPAGSRGVAPVGYDATTSARSPGFADAAHPGVPGGWPPWDTWRDDPCAHAQGSPESRGGGGNRTRVLQCFTRASPGAACPAFLSPGGPAGQPPTGSAAVGVL